MRKKQCAAQPVMVTMEGRIADLSPKQILLEQAVCRCGNFNACKCQPTQIWIPKSIIKLNPSSALMTEPKNGLWERGAAASFKIPVWFFRKVAAPGF